ncbi:3022_t:CDS:2 [Entrophospora sp. SA101]|nr:8776_t:CDS:2 [Entrophospora sp. SA101]CAJ0833250.1 3022_t:CDS:2 [Entrophospora sp. SA101]
MAHERFESYRKIFQETVAMDYRVGIRTKHTINEDFESIGKEEKKYLSTRKMASKLKDPGKCMQKKKI